MREVRLIRSKIERLEGIVEERLISSDEPLGDEAEAMREYSEAKERGNFEYIPLEEIEQGETNRLQQYRVFSFYLVKGFLKRIMLL